MNKIEFLSAQLCETHSFVNRLISELPQDLWYEIPAGTDSNFAWQIGHLIISRNFHAVSVITGRNEKINKIIPLAKYVKLFNGMGTLHRSVELNTILPAVLWEQWNMIHEISVENLRNLPDEILNNPLEPIPFKHPVANTKYEALSWCFKHEMWHCAEMEEIKRRLNYPIVWQQ